MNSHIENLANLGGLQAQFAIDKLAKTLGESRMGIDRSCAPPTEPGLYVAEIYFGWKLLEWKDGAWYHASLTPGAFAWPDSMGVYQWIGPLPAMIGHTPTPVLEFDL